MNWENHSCSFLTAHQLIRGGGPIGCQDHEPDNGWHPYSMHHCTNGNCGLLGLVLLTVRFSFITLCDIVVYAHAHELRLRPELLPLALLLLGPRTFNIVVVRV